MFRDELPKGPPPRREVVHSIEVQPGSEPTYRTPYRLRPAEQDELEEQVKSLLAQGLFVQAKVHMELRYCLYRRRMDDGECALTIAH